MQAETTFVRRVVASLLFASVVPQPVSAGHPERTPAYGGAGGGPIEAVCPPGTFLTGVAAQFSSQMDHIRIYCAAARPDGWWSGYPFLVPGPGMGSPTPQGWAYASCPRNSYVKLIHVGTYLPTATSWDDEGSPFYIYVDGAYFVCYFPETKYRYSIGVGPLRPPNVAFKYRDDGGWDECEGLARGIHGRSGVFVDRLGLLCGSFAVQPRADCMSCHDQPPLNRLRASNSLPVSGALLAASLAAAVLFVRLRPTGVGFSQARRLQRQVLLATAVAAAFVALWVRTSLIDTVHAPWGPIAVLLSVLAVATIGLGIGALVRYLPARPSAEGDSG